MKKQASSRRARKAPKGKLSTKGRDNLLSNTSRKDYFVAEALEMTPHPNQRLVATLGRPIMDRRLKYSIFESSALTGSNATSATPLSLVSISQGTTDITRTGDRIRAKRLWMSGRLGGSAGAAGPTSTRVLVVLWNPVGNASVNSPIASQVVQFSTGYGPYGSYSRDFGDSYQVVYDAVFSVKPLTTSTEGDLFHIDRELTVDMEFIAGSTTPATNNLYIFLLTDASANSPSLIFSSTVWYEDLDA